MKNGLLIKGAFVISLSTIISKVLGAFYRIPLTSILGAEGIGIYQLVFPFYTILLTLSSTGIPNGLSKIIAEGKNAEIVLKKSLLVFGTIGLVGTAFMIVFAKKIAMLQGNPLAEYSYYTLSPSVFLVSMLSCFRGYFQGKSNMLPTAISQVVEQSIKLCFGLLLCNLFKDRFEVLTSLATLSVTISELFAICYIFIAAHLKRKKELKNFNSSLLINQDSLVLNASGDEKSQNENISARVLFAVVFPIMLSAILLPLARVLDSFLIINLMKLSQTEATAQYGLYTGGVESLIGVPVAMCYGLSTAGLPIIAKTKSKAASNNLIYYTILFSLIFVVVTFFSSSFVVNVLYKGLSDSNKLLLINLLKASSVQIFFLAFLQSISAVMIAKNYLYMPSVNLAVAVVVKIILLVTLLPSRLGIYGAVVSDIACYFVAGFLDLLYIKVHKARKNRKFFFKKA